MELLPIVRAIKQRQDELAQPLDLSVEFEGIEPEELAVKAALSHFHQLYKDA